MRDNGPIALRIGITTAGVINYQIPIGATAVVYTDHISLCDLNDFALTYKVACTGTPNIKIELEQAMAPPIVPNGVDDDPSPGSGVAGKDSRFAVPETLAPIETSLTNKYTHHRQLAPVTVEFYRFKLTELTGTVTNTTIQMWLSVQRKWGV